MILKRILRMKHIRFTFLECDTIENNGSHHVSKIKKYVIKIKVNIYIYNISMSEGV